MNDTLEPVLCTSGSVSPGLIELSLGRPSLRWVRMLGGYDLSTQEAPSVMAPHGDGTSLLWVAEGRHNQLFRFDVVSGNEMSRHTLPDQVGETPAGLAGIGSVIWWAGLKGIWRIDATGAHCVWAYPERCNPKHASWSPDGKLLLLIAQVGARLTAYLVDTTLGSMVGRPSVSVSEARNAWMLPDGSGALFVPADRKSTLAFTAFPGKKKAIPVEVGGRVQSCVFPRNDGALLVLDNHQLVYLDLVNRSVQWQLTLPSPIRELVVTPNGTNAIALCGGALLLFELNPTGASLIGTQKVDGKSSHLVCSAGWCAVYESSKRVRVFEVPTLDERVLGAGHGASVNAVAWLNDGKRLVSLAAADREIRVWDVNTARTTFAFEVPEKGAEGLCPHPDGRSVVVGHGAGARVFSLETGIELSTLAGPHEFTYVALSPDGATLYGVSGMTLGKNDPRVPAKRPSLWAWRLGDEEVLWRVRVPSAAAALAVSDDDTSVWIAEDLAFVRFDTQTGEEQQRVPSRHPISFATFSRGARSAVIASFTNANGAGLAWWGFLIDLSTGEARWQQSGLAGGEKALSADRCVVAYGSLDILRTATGDRLALHWNRALKNDDFESLAFSADERRLASGTQRGAIFIFDVL